MCYGALSILDRTRARDADDAGGDADPRADAPAPFRRSWSCGWHVRPWNGHKGNHDSKIAERG
jgi:hypothetical protein